MSRAGRDETREALAALLPPDHPSAPWRLCVRGCGREIGPVTYRLDPPGMCAACALVYTLEHI